MPKMELDGTYMYNEEEQRGALHYSIRVEARGEEETRLTKNNMEENQVEDKRRVAGWKSQTTVRALAVKWSGWKENVKALCALWHEEIYYFR